MDNHGAGDHDLYPLLGTAALLLSLQEGSPGWIQPHHEDHPRLPRLHNDPVQPDRVWYDGPRV